MNEQIWKDNLAVIQQRWPHLAHRLEDTQADECIGAPSRNGLWVLHTDGGQAVHSMYAPERESARFCENCHAESILFLGFGCGYQLLPFLKEQRFRRLLILESSLARLKAVLHHVDRRDVLADERVELTVLGAQDEFLAWISVHYHPIWHGELANYPLRPIVDQQADYFRSVLQGLSEYFHMMAGDLSSQAFFAKTWFTNILMNLHHHQSHQRPLDLPVGRPVVLAGAAPSLEEGIGPIKEMQGRGHFVIACDAALRPLLQNGIKPDLVLSLDAQPLVSRHFVGVNPSEITLLCDIASPPSLARQYGAYFFAGGHPLARLSGLGVLDTQGGNVGYAVLALGKLLSRDITCYGFDFCFPQAKSYAREVYVYPEFMHASCRLGSLENDVLSLVFRYQHLQKEKSKHGLVYTPALFLDYRRAFGALMQQDIQPVGAAFACVRGQDFIHNYRKRVLALDARLAGRQESRHDPVLMTLAPLAAYFVRDNLKVDQAWAHAIDWAQDFLKNRI